MKFKLRIACAALLLAATGPAWALQFGQIQVKSALNQPLVAAIPLHPKNLTELDGLTVGLAPATDFTRAGLQLTPTDRTLQFRVVTDNNGQKLILVTSSQPITDPYLDFLLQVGTRQGRQVREFVVLLNPVIAAPAPVIQAAPVANTPAVSTAQPAELPPSSAFAQPAPQPATKPAATAPKPKPVATAPKQVAAPPKPKPIAATPKPKPVAKAAKPVAPPPPPPPPKPAVQPQAAPARTNGTIPVARGDTLYGIAQQQTQGTSVSINQMMLALQATNPQAFFKNNINNLKAGAILRIPTRSRIDQTSLAEANAEVHRQYEAWRAARPHAATVVEGTAAEAAAKAAPKPGENGPASDHLTLVPPTGRGGGTSNRSGVAGGTGTETVAGLHQQLQNDHGTLVSLKQSNADLESRVRSLKNISGKTGKLLSFKDTTIAELQRKLAAMQSGKAGVASVAGAATASAHTVAGSAASQAAAAAARSAKPASEPPTPSHASGTSWLNRPLTWIVVGLIVLALILIGWLGKRRGRAAAAVAKGPLPDPEDVAPQQEASDEEATLRAELAENPDDLAAHLDLCRLYYTRNDEQGFIEAAQAMREHVTDTDCVEWHEVTVMGEDLAPHLSLFEPPVVASDAPHGAAASHVRISEDALAAWASVSHGPESALDKERDEVPDEPLPLAEAGADGKPVVQAAGAAQPVKVAVAKANDDTEFADDPVDTKLDLARAYIDMGDPVGARAMLEEVLEEGSQTQQDEAKRLLADVAG